MTSPKLPEILSSRLGSSALEYGRWRTDALARPRECGSWLRPRAAVGVSPHLRQKRRLKCEIDDARVVGGLKDLARRACLAVQQGERFFEPELLHSSWRR
jgi:hypothetical protein